jgi:HK97 gp10 family phage protein
MIRITSFHNSFKAITKRTIDRLDAQVRKTARRIRTKASATAPKDTGALRASMYASLDTGSDYLTRAANALQASRNNTGTKATGLIAAGSIVVFGSKGSTANPGAEIVPEVQAEHPHEAIVGSAVAHAVYNEMGSMRMSARPFLAPAVVAEAGRFQSDIDKVFE